MSSIATTASAGSAPAALAVPAGQQEPAAANPRSDRLGPVAKAMWTFRRELAWVLVFSAFANLLTLTPTVYMLQLFDRVMVSGSTLTLIAVTLLMLFFVAAMALAEWVRSRLMVRAGSRLDDALNRRVFLGAYEAQLREPQRSPQQPLVDLGLLRQFFTGNGMFAIADLPWSILFIGVLFLMHPWLGWLSVAFCALQLALALGARWLMNSRQRDLMAADMDQVQYLQAKLRNSETVAAMGMQVPLKRHWLERHGTQTVHQARLQESAARVQALMKWVQYTQQALVLALGGLLAIDGQITSGAMIASNVLMGSALRPIGLAVQVWGQAMETRAAWQRLDTILGLADAATQDAPLPALSGQVSLRQVTVKVPGREQPILDQIEADFKAGELVAIVGPSGAGKSTLARCILGVWPGHAGQVLFDGHDLRSLPSDTLGEQLGYLPQDVELFEGSIAQNIARFGPADPDAIVKAAKMAGIHDMVLRMPKGYDTLVGEAGATLSGGQRQRLGLARALLGDPSIVVLDEPNANLDDAGEAALVAALGELRARGTTIFMIVHRHHLLKLADRLLVLDNGRLLHLGPIKPTPAVETKDVRA